MKPTVKKVAGKREKVEKKIRKALEKLVGGVLDYDEGAFLYDRPKKIDRCLTDVLKEIKEAKKRWITSNSKG